MKKICKEIYPFRKIMQYEVLLLQLISMIVAYLISGHILLIAFDILLLTSAFLIFILLKDFESDDEIIENMYKRLRLSIIIGCVVFINHFVWDLANTFSAFKILSILSIIFIPIILFTMLRKPDVDEKIHELIEVSIWDANRKIETHKGDVQVGISMERKKPIILKENDRYVHMLVLGPTGCGKTSQILTPMVSSDIKNKDMGVIVLDPKGDFAEKAFALGKIEGRKVNYFNPIMRNCPYFNPLMGDEDEVIENLVTTLKAFDTDSKGYFQDNNENLVRRAVKVLKRLYGDDATLAKLDILINNVGGEGSKMINSFSKLKVRSEREKNENDAIVNWFSNEYLPGTNGGGGRGVSSKTFEASSGVRNQIQKLISNRFLNKILNPPSLEELKEAGEENNFLDFKKILEDGEVCALCSGQGSLGALSNFLGFFLILQIQSAVFKRPGNEKTRRGCMLYIDEFQTYANPGMSNMLTQGRSYRVASILATQNRALIGANSGNQARSFIDLVSTNARNIVIFPGLNGDDAKYYSAEFGEDRIMEENITVSKSRFGMNLSGQKESIRVEEKYKARFRPTDIIYNKFGEALIRIIGNNSVQRPEMLKVSWISKRLTKQVNKIVEAYNEEYTLVSADELDEIEAANKEEETFFRPKDLFEFGEDEFEPIPMPTSAGGGFDEM